MIVWSIINWRILSNRWLSNVFYARCTQRVTCWDSILTYSRTLHCILRVDWIGFLCLFFYVPSSISMQLVVATSITYWSASDVRARIPYNVYNVICFALSLETVFFFSFSIFIHAIRWLLLLCIWHIRTRSHAVLKWNDLQIAHVGCE